MKFRKKPVIIEAEQLTSEIILDCLINNKPGPFDISISGKYNKNDRKLYDGYGTIYTLEGTMRADIDDWIIKGIKGELYPCKNDIFIATYEKVSE